MENFLRVMVGIVKMLFTALGDFVKDTPPHLLGIYLAVGLIVFVILFVRGNHK